MKNNIINGLKIDLDVPYPSIDNLIPNKKLAYKLKEAYAGETSELSCISKYIFQHIYLSDEYKEIKNILRKIAIIEMHHLDILGNMIKKLGLVPAYTSINKVENESYWESNFISYETDIHKFILENINGEEKAIKFYKNIINYADDIIVTDILNRIILDEENHVKIFESILNSIKN